MANGNQPTGLIGILSQPIAQLGFAGLCVALLGIIVWMISINESRIDKILQLQTETNKVIQGNTAAIQELSRMVSHYQPPTE